MNRLQVGDEVYVRDVKTGEIHKTYYDHQVMMVLVMFKKYFRIVYPFPCVKALAQ